MDNEEIKTCLYNLNKPKGFLFGNDISKKLECLRKFKDQRSPAYIYLLIPFLKDDNEIMRLRTAEVVISLVSLLKSHNQLYHTLRNLAIKIDDINYYKDNYPNDIWLSLCGIASLNHDGHVREKSVNELQKIKHPAVIRLLLFRISDWILPVRNAAWAGLKKFFLPEYKNAFLAELALIELLQKVERLDLSSEYNTILQFLMSTELTIAFYNELQINDFNRLIYIKKYFNLNQFNKDTVQIVLHDTNFLIRIEIIKHLHKISQNEQEVFINQLLFDSSSQVRLSALYFIKDHIDTFESKIAFLSSDKSAAVRELSRYLLKNRGYDFHKLYQEKIIQKKALTGSILGLTEVGSRNDLELFKKFILKNETPIKLASLIAIQKFDLSLARIYSLDLLNHHSNKLRTRCIKILSQVWDNEIHERAINLYQSSKFEHKKSILRLYNTIGGWEVICDLILAVSDNDLQIQNLAWDFLKKWKNKSLHLFTTPPSGTIKKAKEAYNNTDLSKIGMTNHRKMLWVDLKCNLR